MVDIHLRLTRESAQIASDLLYRAARTLPAEEGREFVLLHKFYLACVQAIDTEDTRRREEKVSAARARQKLPTPTADTVRGSRK